MNNQYQLILAAKTQNEAMYGFSHDIKFNECEVKLLFLCGNHGRVRRRLCFNSNGIKYLYEGSKVRINADMLTCK